jgi:alkyl hydroperoxide reductase subunit AhpC
VCTTELSAVSLSYADFQSRGVKVSSFNLINTSGAKRANNQLIGLSANNVDSHHGWVKDVDNLGGGHLEFPIIGDEDRKVSELYGMLDHQDASNVDKKGLPFTVRTVFISEFLYTICGG